MNSKKLSLAGSRLYLILDKGACGSRSMAYVLKKALAGGVDMVQWRDKVSATNLAVREARRLLGICRRHRVPFIVNDRLDVAMAVSGDGIHLGQDDLPVATARRLFGDNALIGLSCQNRAQIKKALKEKVDYLGFGPVFLTKTKSVKKILGVRAMGRALKSTRLPVFAIGGINANNLEGNTFGDKTRIAVCREICRAKNITETTKLLKNKLLFASLKIKK